MKSSGVPKVDALYRTLKIFHRVTLFAFKVSAASNGMPTTDAGEMASMIHTKMCVNAASVEKLAKEDLFDHSAIMTVCRMIIDGMTMYFYLSESISDSEWECRNFIIRLHDTTCRIKLLRAEQDKTEYQDLIEGKDSLIEQLRKNEVFNNLSSEQQTRILSGEQIFLGGMRAAAVRAAGWQEERFGAFYNYFSAHAHSAPMSFLRFKSHGIDFAEPSDAQRNMVGLALNIAEFCLLKVSMHYLFQNSELYSRFDAKELQKFRKELADSTIQKGGKA